MLAVMRAIAIASVLSLLPAQELTLENLESWRDAIAPTSEEDAFRGIGWRPSLGEGLVEGQARDMPVLVWAMNGHPLGLT